MLREDRDKKLGLRDVGAALGIDPTRISRLETGNSARGVTGVEAAAFAAYYGVSAEWILRGEESGSTEFLEWMRSYESQGLDESGKRTVRKVAEQQVEESKLRRATPTPAEAELLELLNALGGSARIQQELRVARQELARQQDSPADTSEAGL